VIQEKGGAKLKLLYMWINGTEQKVFEAQGVSLSDEYRVSFDPIASEITIEKNSQYLSIFENEVIEDVTAIVGSNGVGKTTLLKYLFQQDLAHPPVDIPSSYALAEEQAYQTQAGLLVVLVDNRVKVLHNLQQDINVKSSSPVYVTCSRQGEWPLPDLEQITKVYISNGSNNEGIQHGYSQSFQQLSKVALTPRSISTLSKGFFRAKVGAVSSFFMPEDTYQWLQNAIISKCQTEDFQTICDVLYFRELHRTSHLSRFAGKVPSILTLNCKSLLAMLDSFKDSRSHADLITQKLHEWHSFVSSYLQQPTGLIDIMKLNLILEIDFVSRRSSGGLQGHDLDYILAQSIRQSPSIHRDYFEQALCEVHRLQNVIAGCPTERNLWPQGDLAYQERVVVNRDQKTHAYADFMELIANSANAPRSFILKYLKIGNLDMSSGERAYLNIFSWLRLLPFFSKIDPGVQKMGSSILLLIDEIDLYCHPEWQRKMLKFLLEELTLQFPGGKIQIVFTTHSPILLSDIPLANTVHISKDADGRSKVDDRVAHQETFAANIYQLFNDSFFLESKGAIGEFAANEINRVIRILRSGEADMKILTFIGMIGEPLIRRKLELMFNQYSSESGLRRHPQRENRQYDADEKLKDIKWHLEMLAKMIDNGLGEKHD